jgi:hypothetical protein
VAEDINGATVPIILNIRQAGQGADCTFPLNPTSQNFSASGGTGVFSIRPANAGCSSTYSATSNNSWITVSNPSGQASDNINYTVAPNTGLSRTGTVTVSNPIAGNQTFTINQAAVTATVSNRTQIL